MRWGQILSALIIPFLSGLTWAQTLPSDFTVEGRLFTATGIPYNSQVDLILQVVSESQLNCLLYEEHALNVNVSSSIPTSQGVFALRLGTGTGIVNPNGTLPAVFANGGTLTGQGACTVHPAANDHRLVRIQVRPAGGGAYDVLSPDTRITSVPTAMIADSANTLSGKAIGAFLLTNTNSGLLLDQTHVENVFSPTNYSALTALLNGSSTQYLASTPTAPESFNSQRLTNVADPTGAQDVSTKNYADTSVAGKSVDVTGVGVGFGNGKTLIWDQVQNKWVAQTLAGSISSLVMGNGLVAATITANGTISVDVGTTGNKILQLAAGKIPAVDGSLLTNVNALTALTGDVVATGPGSASSVIQPNTITSAKVYNIGVAVNRLVITDGTSGTTLRYADTCNNGEVLQWSALGWGCVSVNALLGNSGASAGTFGSATQVAQVSVSAQGRVTTLSNVNIAYPVTSVNGKTGAAVLTAADLSLGTAAVQNVGTASGNVVQLASANTLPALDGSALSNLNAVTLQSRPVSSAAPGLNQVLSWNGSTWLAVNAGVGSVTYVGTGTGLVSGNISSTGTLAVDVGTGANQIVQLNGSAQLRAVDGSLLTGVNATKIGTRTIASTAPVSGQVIGWNNSTSQWEPMAGGVGSVTGVVSGTGLVAATLTSNGTINVDVGTTANKIVQLNASAQLPAVDGNLLTNLNAVKLQGKNIVATAPTASQVLRWNSTLSQWEPSNDSSGTITTLFAGTGLSATTITTAGTLNVDVGTVANKILQLNATAQIPGVDGFLVTNVNAVKLQTRAVSAAAPAGGQVLGFNGLNGQWEPTSVGTGSVMSVTSGAGLVAATLTANGTINVDVGTTANKIVQLTASAQLPAVDGSLITNLNAVRIATRTIAATAPVNNQYLGWNALSSQWEPMNGGLGSVTSVFSGAGLVAATLTSSGTINVDVGTAANKIVQLDPSARLPGVDASLLTNVNAVKLQARSISAAAPAGGQFLAYNSTTLQWEPTANPASNDYVNGGNTFGANATLGLKDAFALNFMTNGSPRMTVDQLGNVGVGTTTPGSPLHVSSASTFQTNFQIQNTSAGGRSYLLASTGSVGTGGQGNFIIYDSTAVATRLLIGANGNIGMGTVTPQAALDVSSTGTYSALLVPRDTAANRPGGINGMIRYNTSLNKFEAFENSAWSNVIGGGGTVTSVTIGSGLINPGTFTTVGTVAVDVGTVASKIVQLTATAQYPAVDGFLITNVNAVKLQSRSVSGTAPTAGQFLGYNSTTSQWEATANPAGNDFVFGGNSFGVASTLGNKDFYSLNLITNGAARMTLDQLGNVGIGTTSPVSGLELQGFASGANGIFKISNKSTQSSIPIANFLSPNMTSAQQTYLNLGRAGTTYDSAYLSFFNAGPSSLSNRLDFGFLPVGGPAPVMSLMAGGGVGIGTVTPNGLLDVEGGTAAANTAGIGITLQAQNAGAGAGNLNGGNINLNPGTNTNGGAYGYVNVNGPMQILNTENPTGSTKVYLEHKDMTTGFAELQMYDYTNTITRWSVGSTSRSNVIPNSFYIYEYNNAAGTALNTYRFTIADGGNVGIGTGTPLAALDVTSVGTTSALLVPRDTTGNRPFGINGMIRYNSSLNKFEAYENGAWSNLIVSGGAPSFVNGGNTFGAISTVGNKDAFALNLATNNVPRMTIDQLGNVGIGVTSPGDLLHVSANSNYGAGLYLQNLSSGVNALGRVLLANDAGAQGGISLTSSSNNSYGGASTLNLGTVGTNALAFLTNSSIRMYLNPAGNVAIGTNTPDAKLLVSANTDPSILPPQPGSVMHVAAADGAPSRLAIDSYGSGVTSSLDLRQINGTAASPSSVPNGATLGQIAWFGYGSTSNLTVRARVQAYSTENSTDTTQGTALAFSTTTNTTNTLSERMRIDNTGNVGIGTPTPTATLHVMGQIVSQEYNAGSSTTLDFSKGNSQITSGSIATITVNNMVPGGVYFITTTNYNGANAAFSGSCAVTKLSGSITSTASSSPVTPNTTYHILYLSVGSGTCLVLDKSIY